MLAVVTDLIDDNLSLDASSLTWVVGCDGEDLWMMSAIPLDEMTVVVRVALVRVVSELEASAVARE